MKGMRVGLPFAPPPPPPVEEVEEVVEDELDEGEAAMELDMEEVKRSSV